MTRKTCPLDAAPSLLALLIAKQAFYKTVAKMYFDQEIRKWIAKHNYGLEKNRSVGYYL